MKPQYGSKVQDIECYTQRNVTPRLPSLLVFWLVAKSCPTLCDPVNCNPPTSLSMGFSRQEY